MASRVMDATQEFGKKRKTVRVMIFPNGTGVPTWRSCGGVTSVVRTSTGLFTVTLDDSYYKLVGTHATVQLASAGAYFAQAGVVSNVGTSTRVTAQALLVNGSGSPTDLAADPNNSITLALHFEDSSALSTDH